MASVHGFLSVPHNVSLRSSPNAPRSLWRRHDEPGCCCFPRCAPQSPRPTSPTTWNASVPARWSSASTPTNSRTSRTTRPLSARRWWQLWPSLARACTCDCGFSRRFHVRCVVYYVWRVRAASTLWSSSVARASCALGLWTRRSTVRFRRVVVILPHGWYN